MMELQFREMRSTDIESHFDVRNAAREIRSRALLTRLGIALAPSAADLLSGRIKIWECVHGSKVVGHCAGDSATGEITSLAVSTGYEGMGIGRKLLSLAVGWLHSAGAKRIWLTAPSDPALRAYGFYRALGWRPTGEQTGKGNETLELPIDNGHCKADGAG